MTQASSIGETERQRAELAALDRMLAFSAGKFSLGVAVCNSVPLRDYLIEKVRSAHPGVKTVDVPAAGADVLSLVRESIRDSMPPAIFVVGLEHAIPAQAEEYPILRALNASRELWPGFVPMPVVLWLPEYAAGILAVQARDFWAWKSHQFDFVSELATPEAGILDRSLRDTDLVVGLDFDQKRFRLAELEQRIAESGDPPKPELLPHVVAWFNEMGAIRRILADFAGAKAAFQRALKIDEAAYGPDHPEVATDVSNLGGVLHDLGDLAEAKAAYERALRIAEKAYGHEHPNVGVALSNLGNVLGNIGDLAGAKAACKRALRIAEKAYGLEHPNVAIAVNNLGGVLHDMGDLAGAKAAFEQALRSSERTYGPDHPIVARYASNLGVVLRKLGDLAGAKATLERALRVDKKVHGPDHPEVARDLNNLGLVLKRMGDLAGARAAYEMALNTCRNVLGNEHPHTKTVLENLEALGK